MLPLLLSLIMIPSGMEIVHSSEKEIVISYSPQFSAGDIMNIEGCSHPVERGVPCLPEVYLYIAIPLESKINLSLEEANIKGEREMEVLPVPEVYEHGYEYIKDESIYERDILYPSDVMYIEKRGFIRGQEFVMVKIHPIRYNPEREVVTIYERIKFRVSFVSGKGGERIIDPYFEDTFKRLFINYENGKNWRKRRAKMRIEKDDNPWVKIELEEKGIYRITYNDLRNIGIDPDFINPASFKLFTQGGSLNIFPDDTLKEVPIYIKDEAIYFYATSTAGGEKNKHTYLNIFTDMNVYWLTYGGVGRRDSMVCDESPLYFPEEFTDTIHIEEDNICPAKSGRGWAWTEIKRMHTASQSYIVSFCLPEVKTNSAIGKFVIYGYYFKSQENPMGGDMPHYVRLYMNGTPFAEDYWIGGSSSVPHIIVDTVLGLVAGGNELKIELYRCGGLDTKPDTAAEDWIYLDYFELYPRLAYHSRDGEIRFRVEDTPSELHLSGFGSCPLIFNINNELSPIRVKDVVYEDGEAIFQTTKKGPYYAATSFKSPLSIKTEDPNNIKNISAERVDYIIITKKDFYYPARELLKYREEKDSINGEIVFIDDVYNNFSFGLKNPWGIRNFLKFAYENWNTGYVLLFGSGTYAYRWNISKNIIPPWQGEYFQGSLCYHIGEFGLSPRENPCYDTWYTMVSGDDDSPDMAIGRITAETIDDARTVVEKIMEYERSFGPWRGRVLLSADDGFESDAEGLYNSTPISYDVFKVYIIKYPGEDRGEMGNFYLLKYINKGMYYGMYIGHGNLRRLAHENIWKLSRDINTLSNANKYPIFFYASCGVGAFDRPYERCTADYMQIIEGKGAIATAAATRSTYNYENTDVGTPLFEYTVTNPLRTIGDAFLLSINEGDKTTIHTLFGDPMTDLSCYKNNKISVSPDSLVGGLHTEVTTTSEDIDEGYAYITAYGKEECWSYKKGTVCELGDVIFRGQTLLEDTISFFTPLGLEPGQGKVTGYLWDGESGGRTGKKVWITGRDTTTQDTTGPKIDVFVNGKRITEEIEVEREFTMTALLEDPSGIILIEGEGIRLEIKGGENYQLEDFFEYDIGSAVKGELVSPIKLETSYPVDTLTLIARDNLGNQSEFLFTVRKVFSEGITLEDPINYPNPVTKDRTRIEFFSSKPGWGKIKIFTISGRLIKTINIENVRPGINEKEWDTRDEFADRVGNGIYIYKIEVKNEKAEADCIGKMMIMR